uniref:Uncharacterized protein n=1 Tax=Lygus hesperus TaxID=30085 RepID=A0A146L0L5_LYGHE
MRSKRDTWSRVLTYALSCPNLDAETATKLLTPLDGSTHTPVAGGGTQVQLPPHPCYFGTVTGACDSVVSVALAMGGSATYLDAEGNTPVLLALQRTHSSAVLLRLLDRSTGAGAPSHGALAATDLRTFECIHVTGRYRYYSYIDIALVLRQPQTVVARFVHNHVVPTKWSCFLFHELALQQLQCMQCYPSAQTSTLLVQQNPRRRK